jgi:hypothetical protein
MRLDILTERASAADCETLWIPGRDPSIGAVNHTDYRRAK